MNLAWLVIVEVPTSLEDGPSTFLVSLPSRTWSHNPTDPAILPVTRRRSPSVGCLSPAKEAMITYTWSQMSDAMLILHERVIIVCKSLTLPEASDVREHVLRFGH